MVVHPTSASPELPGLGEGLSKDRQARRWQSRAPTRSPQSPYGPPHTHRDGATRPTPPLEGISQAQRPHPKRPRPCWPEVLDGPCRRVHSGTRSPGFLSWQHRPLAGPEGATAAESGPPLPAGGGVAATPGPGRRLLPPLTSSRRATGRGGGSDRPGTLPAAGLGRAAGLLAPAVADGRRRPRGRATAPQPPWGTSRPSSPKSSWTTTR